MGGRYVAFEGIEGAGKTSVAALVAQLLRDRGHDVVEVREPGGTAAGEAIRELLLHSDHLEPWAEALLFAAARSELAAAVIQPALARGAWVLGDRSVYSSLAYQGAGRGLGMDAVRAVNEAGLGGVWPDRVVLLDVAADEGLARQEVTDRIGGQGAGFQEAVAGAFAQLAAAVPDRFVVFDGAARLEDVGRRALAALTGT